MTDNNDNNTDTAAVEAAWAAAEAEAAADAAWGAVAAAAAMAALGSPAEIEALSDRVRVTPSTWVPCATPTTRTDGGLLALFNTGGDDGEASGGDADDDSLAWVSSSLDEEVLS